VITEEDLPLMSNDVLEKAGLESLKLFRIGMDLVYSKHDASIGIMDESFVICSHEVYLTNRQT